MKEEKYDIIVIGGGPSGMMASGRAGELGARVLLIEKNEELGKKLNVTGGGRCNITNAEFDNHLFLDNFPESKQFLFSPFSQFNVESTFSFFENHGLPLIVEDRKRAFPKSEKAEDVTDLLEDYIRASGNVTIKFNTSIKSFIVVDDVLLGVRSDNCIFYASKIILATGGLAAPSTGATDSGLSMLGSIGHKITESDPDLSPLKTSSKWVHYLSGITLDDMTLRFIQEDKTELKVRGRLLFTHFGISGPLVINSAHQVKEFLKRGNLIASIDLFPDYDLGSLNDLIIDLFEKNKNKLLKTVLKELIPKKLSDVILDFPGLNIGDIFVHSIKKEQRKLLVDTIKNLRFPIIGTMGLDWSIVADGGVSPSEVNFKNMNSKLFSNLYLVGDVLNINRHSGGFSLQLCWTTGWIAGTHSAENISLR